MSAHAALVVFVVGLTVLVHARLIRYYLHLRRDYALVVTPGLVPAAGRVSVLLPARNEEHNIARALASLRAQDYADLEILVLDDGSEDRTWEVATAAAAGDPRVKLLRGAPLPAGWTGKCHALHQLAAHASGRWLLLTDADCEHHPHGVSAAVGYAVERNLQFLSALGIGLSPSFWERVFNPVWPSLILYLVPPRAANDPRSPLAFSCGQFILIQAEALKRLGGHEALRQDIVEDCGLMALVKRAGMPFRVLLRTDLYRVRMYRNLGEIWEGWSKNAYPVQRKLGRGTLAVAAMLGAILAITVLPFALGWPTAVFAWAVALAMRASSRTHPAYFLTYPLGGLLTFAILANSTLRSLTGSTVSWKGRHYDPLAHEHTSSDVCQRGKRGEGD